MPLQQNLLCLIPIPILHRALEICAMMTVQVLEYAILILQSSVNSLRSAILNRR